jgi:hypothetical protein
MSPARHRRRQLVRRVGRRLALVAVTLAGLRLSAAVVGDLVTAAAAALAFTIGSLAWWARVVEHRLFAPRHTPPPSAQLIVAPSAPPDDARHLAFAQALAAVAARYLAECEQEGRR